MEMMWTTWKKIKIDNKTLCMVQNNGHWQGSQNWSEGPKPCMVVHENLFPEGKETADTQIWHSRTICSWTRSRELWKVFFEGTKTHKQKAQDITGSQYRKELI